MWKDVLIFLKKEIKQEWRKRHAIQSILTYLIGTIFVCYICFYAKSNSIHPISWNALFWIIALFIAVSAGGKSFLQESDGKQLYYYSLIRPEVIITAKLIYNTVLISLLLGIEFIFYQLVTGNPIQKTNLFIITLILAAIGFASILTLVSAIASKANQNNLLTAILSFPLLIPMLAIAIRLCKKAIDDIDISMARKDILVLASLNLITITLSYILFPYIWRN